MILLHIKARHVKLYATEASGPVHTYLDIFENKDFFLCFQKNLHPHEAYSNRFCPSTQKR